MAGYNILRAVSFNNQVMNIIFEVSRTLWNSIGWNWTKWIQIDFDVSLVHWLDNRRKRRKAKATTNNMALNSKKLPRWNVGVFLFGCVYRDHYPGSKYDFVASKRHWEKITVLGGSHCMEHRDEMFLYYHYNGLALGAIIPSILHGALNPWYSKCGLQTAGAWGAVRNWKLDRSVESRFPHFNREPQVMFAHIFVRGALLGWFHIVLYDLIFRLFSEVQGIALI